MDPDRAVQFVQSAAAATAVWRLARLKLAKRFPALVAWLCVLAVSNLLATALSRFQGSYFWFYVAYVPTYCIFSLLAVGELFALAFRDYPGIRSVGRGGMYAGTLLATAASILLAGVFRRTSTHGSRHLLDLEVGQRSVVFSLVVVILTILFVLSRYPLHLGRNNYLSSAFFSVLFLSDAARLLIDSLQSQLHSDAVDLTEGCFQVLCLVTWASLLRRDNSPTLRGPRPPTAEDEHLLEQLESLNQLLGRTVRR